MPSPRPDRAGLLWWLGSGNATQLLQRERQARRDAEQLAAGTRWRTDDQHRLQSWAPLEAPPRIDCALFGDAASPLRAALQGQVAFHDLAVRSAEPVDGSRGWRLSGVPCWDDQGAFAGFEGRARPTDAAERQALAAALLAPLLAATPGPVALVLRREQGFVLDTANAAALALWPGHGEGTPLAQLLARWPDALAAVPDMAAGSAQQFGPWRVARLDLPGHEALLLTQPQAALPDAATAAGESDTFSFTLSHDLRAPIRVVEGFTRIVKEDYGRQLDRVGNDHLERVLGAAARMNLMIDALLTLARLSQQPLARQRVNLSQLAQYVADDLKRGAPEREAEFQIEPRIGGWGDPTLLRLVLENLLGNAWKYSAKVSPALITMREVPHGDGNRGRAIVIRDNGAGFDMRSAERLFGLFQRLHSASDFAGHGVGLASVKRIVQRHGGQVWAESEPGKGAAFYFTLAP